MTLCLQGNRKQLVEVESSMPLGASNMAVYLYSRVDLQKVVVPLLVHHEFHSAGIAVLHMAGNLQSIPVKCLSDFIVQTIGWSHLNHLQYR